MTEQPSQALAPLRTRRDETIQVLVAEFANDRLTMEEFEQRLDLAHRAGTTAELDALLADLRPAAPVVSTEARSVASLPAPVPVALPAEIRESQTLIAIMGGVERRGRWTPARKTNLLAFMGGGELDFRDAQLGPGVTEITIGCFMGGFEIIVPPGLAVDAGGIAIMGGFGHAEHGPSAAGANAPVLKINGIVFMGGVDIQVRGPGESARDARTREKEDRRRLKDEQKRLRQGGDV